MTKSKGKEVIKLNGAQICKKCGMQMQRYEHAKSWQPRESQAYWFEWWDKCLKCGLMQMYEEAKRHVR